MYIAKFLKTFHYANIVNHFKKYLYNTKIPNGRWNIENEYNGSMSNTAVKNNEYNNHDHCGGELCKYPPQPKKKIIYRGNSD